MSEKQVKTKRKVKRRLKVKGVLFLLVLFLVFFLSIKMILKLNIVTVVVTGNNYMKDSEIIKSAGFANETKIFGFKSKDVCNELLKNELIATCKIERKLDLKVEIKITENVPLFYYTSESSVILSNGGRVKEMSIPGIPTLINLTTEKVLNEFIAGLSDVKSDIIRSISEIEYSPSVADNGTFIDEERFILSMTDGNTVIINNRHLDVLNHYDTIYATLGDRKGTLNFDCDFGNYPFTEYGE
ncbi:MAG TPA: hypothetical protein DCY94_02700 [Firmicutes bacterium]|nr:hypothetical protein [Bacillota bacterium]